MKQEKDKKKPVKKKSATSSDKKTEKRSVAEHVPEEEAVKEKTETADVGVKKHAAEVADDAKFKKPDRYFEAVGRRKTAIARVRLFTRAGDFTVNEKAHNIYFPTETLQKTAEDSLQKMKLLGRFRVSVKISGGGVHSQAEAIRHGLARCLIKFNPDFRKRLKRAGFLKRDPRAKERKKFGLKKARRAPQWAKR